MRRKNPTYFIRLLSSSCYLGKAKRNLVKQCFTRECTVKAQPSIAHTLPMYGLYPSPHTSSPASCPHPASRIVQCQVNFSPKGLSIQILTQWLLTTVFNQHCSTLLLLKFISSLWISNTHWLFWTVRILFTYFLPSAS